MNNIVKFHEVILKERREYFILSKNKLKVLTNSSTPKTLVEEVKEYPSIHPDFITTGINRLKGNEDHYEVLKSLIKNAKKTIKLTTFLINDTELVDLLIQKAGELRGGVYILTSRLDRNLARIYNYSRTEENRHYTAISQLSNSMVSVRSIDGLHAKCWIFDDSSAVVTSANLTSNSLKRVFECGIHIRSAKMIDSLNLTFNNLWINFGQMELRDNIFAKISNPSFAFENQNLDPEVNLHVKLKKGNNAWETLDWYDIYYELIDNANKLIQIANYDTDLTGSVLLEKLENQLQNDTQVEFIISKHKFQTDFENRSILINLSKTYSNFHLNIHDNIHGKFVIIDDSQCYITTKNYCREDKYDSSFDLGLRVDHLKDDLMNVWTVLVKQSSRVQFIPDKSTYLYEITKDIEESILSSDYTIWIWHPQQPVYGYLGETVNLQFIAKLCKNVNLIKIYDLNPNNDFRCAKIVRLTNNFRLHLDSNNGLIRIDESGAYVPNDQILNKWVLGSEKIIFKQYVSNN